VGGGGRRAVTPLSEAAMNQSLLNTGVRNLTVAGNAEEAGALWEEAGAVLPADYAGALIPYLAHPNEDVRSAAADGLAAAVEVRCCAL